MKSVRKKIIRCASAFLTIAVLTTGCSIGGKNIRLTTGLSDSELFKIDGSAFKVSEAMLFLTTEKNLYEDSYGAEIWTRSIGDITFEEYVKNSVKNSLAEIKTLTLLAEEKKIKLSNEEKELEQAMNYHNLDVGLLHPKNKNGDICTLGIF